MFILCQRARRGGGAGGSRSADRGRACASARSDRSSMPSPRTGSAGTRPLLRTATDRG